jgi:hypothetical protein
MNNGVHFSSAFCRGDKIYATSCSSTFGLGLMRQTPGPFGYFDVNSHKWTPLIEVLPSASNQLRGVTASNISCEWMVPCIL